MLVVTKFWDYKKSYTKCIAFLFHSGGKGWIRTIEDIVDGFTVRCIWPLCNLPKWSWRKESNLQPADYKSAALPLSHASKRLPIIKAFKENCFLFINQFIQINNQFSYILIVCWCPKVESNHRHCSAFQFSHSILLRKISACKLTASLFKNNKYF